ncbi:PAS domain S-box protein [Desulforhopalus sp. IMCC35007]|nr:PAS domain S-box protein [Desulforhopalus sp. IMCC35007]
MPQCLIYVVWDILKKRFQCDYGKNSAASAGEDAGFWPEIYDLLDDIITVQDENYRVVKANKAALVFFGLSAQSLENLHCYELYGDLQCPCADCPSGVEAPLGLAKPQKSIRSVKDTLVEVQTSLLFPSDSDSPCVVHIAKQINRAETEIKASLLETEGCFAKAFNANPLPMLVSDLKSGVLLDVNQRCLDCFGYLREELLGHSFENIGAWKDGEQWKNLMLELQKNGCIKDYTLQIRTKSGEIKDVLWSAETIVFLGKTVLLSLVDDDTDRRKVERTLKESEEKFSQAFDACPDSVNINRLDDGTFVEVNKGFLEWSGFTREEVIGKTSEELKLWYDLKDREKLVRTLEETGHCENLEAKFYRKDGTPTIGLMSARVVSLNNVPHIISVTRDLGALKRVENEHRRQKNLFETIFNALTDGVVVTDINRIIQIANKGVKLTFGYDPEELVGKSTEVLYAQKQIFHELGEKLFSAQAQKNQTFHHTTYRHRSGKVFQGESFGTKLYNHRNEWIGNLGIMRDITTREKEKKERLGLKTAIEQASDVVLITDYLGAITYVNPAFERVSLYSKKEVIGRNPRFLKSGLHDEKFYENFWQTITSGKTFTGRTVNRRKDGSHYTEEATVTPIVDRFGKIINYIAIKRDITEKLLLESQLQQAQRMEAVGRLTGGVAHDFNNILGVILGYSGMALRNSKPTDRLYNDLKIIYDAASRSADIVRQLLMFSRQQTVLPQTIDLNYAVESMLKMLRRLIGEDIELVWKPYPGILPIKIDPSQVDQILANLCVNARDAITGNGILTISTAKIVHKDTMVRTQMVCAPGEEAIQLVVTDNGAGINPDSLDKIFEPFFTTKEMGHGTGLGLSTVYGIIQQNNGDIAVESQPGVGTTFTIVLPESHEPLSLNKEGGLAQVSEGRNETILLVEDDLTLLDMTRRMLEKTGYIVLPANSGGEALRLAEKNSKTIDLLVSDVIMPEMNGKELSSKILEIIPDLKILFMSGYTSNVIGHNGVLEEGVQFVAKPFSRKDLSDKIRAILHS